MCTPTTEKYGATPAHIQWTVVRGDSASLAVGFFEDDETTPFDISDWTFAATAYDSSGDVLDELTVDVDVETGYATITAPATTTANWGTSYRSVTAELPFDLEVVIPGGSGADGDTVWTPVIGTICVLADITPAGSL